MRTTDSGAIPSFALYGEAPGEAHDRVLHVETIAARGRLHDWRIRPHLHRSLHQLFFVSRGRGEVRLEGAATEFRPPVVMIVPAGTVHGFTFEPKTAGFVASVADDLVRDIARRERSVGALLDAPATFELSAAAVRATDLPRAFQMLEREFERLASGRVLALEALLAVILANILRLTRTMVASAGAAAGRHRLLVARFRELIDGEYRKGATLAGLAAALNVSESQLRIACQKITGESPIKLVHARVLLEAKRQLLYTNMTVSAIAYALGFEDPAYFTRFFSRRAGVSPRSYRLRETRV